MYIYFQVGLPIEATCQVRIDFPKYQPLTSDLSSAQISGANLFATESVITNSVAGNYILINGC